MAVASASGASRSPAGGRLAPTTIGRTAVNACSGLKPPSQCPGSRDHRTLRLVPSPRRRLLLFFMCLPLQRSPPGWRFGYFSFRAPPVLSLGGPAGPATPVAIRPDAIVVVLAAILRCPPDSLSCSKEGIALPEGFLCAKAVTEGHHQHPAATASAVEGPIIANSKGEFVRLILFISCR